MAVLTKSQAESSHWYTADGKAVHQMDTAKGGTRPTDLRDARKFGLFPSVTSILGIFGKPQLETWKLKQVVIASLKNPKQEKESEDYYIKRVIEAAFAQVDKAADFGTLCHLAIEEYIKYQKPIPTDLKVYLDPVIELLENGKMVVSASEATIVNSRFGFAGTKDYSFTYGKGKVGVIDFKTRKTVKDKEVESYPYQDMQIAAYAATYWAKKLGVSEEEALSKCLGANIYISSTEAGRIEVVKYLPEQLSAVFPIFTQACEMWRYIKGYDPRKAISIAPPAPSPVPSVAPEPSEEVKTPPKAKKPKEIPSVAEETVTPPKAPAEPISICKACEGTQKNTKGKPCVCTKTPKTQKPPVAKKEAQKKPVVLDFGKHKGKPLEEIPREYIEWLTTQKKHREDTKLMIAIEEILRSK